MGGFLDDTYFKRYYWFYGQPMTKGVYAAMASPANRYRLRNISSTITSMNVNEGLMARMNE